MKNTTLALGVLLVFSLVMPALASQFGMPDKPLILQNSSQPVTFEHSRHVNADCSSCHALPPMHFPILSTSMNMSCQACHHLIYGEEPPIKTCSSCHFNPDQQSHGMSSLYAMAHARDPIPGTASCLSCHYQVAMQRPEMRNALTSCTDSSCHP